MGINKYPSALYGATVTAGGSNNTKGSYTEFVSSTPEAAQGLIVTILSNGAATRRFLLDIAVGGAGAESVIVADLPFAVGSLGTNPFPSVYVPVGIASGARISARAQSNFASSTATLSLHLVGGTSSATVATYGAVTASTNGTQVDPGGTIDTKGSYVELTASTSATIAWLVVVITGRANPSPTDAQFELDLATGGAGSETLVVPGLCFSCNSLADSVQPPQWSIPVSIPSGSRIAARAASSTNDATDRLFDVVVHGVSNLPSGGSTGAVQLVNGGLVS